MSKSDKITQPSIEMAGEPETVEQYKAKSEELQRAVNSLNRRLIKSQSGRQELIDAVYNAARDAAVVTGGYKPIPILKNHQGSKGRELAALWHLTDWQGGKSTSSYNLDILDQRVDRFCQTATYITNLQREASPVTSVAVFFGGDMSEGDDIFPKQVWELEAPAFYQLFRVVDTEKRVLQSALAAYETVDVYGVLGNHGRLGPRKSNVPRVDNLDLIGYEILRREFESEKRITWHFEYDNFFQNAQIGNYKAMLVHGDQVKQFGGNVPAYGIVRKATSWATGVVPAFTDVYLGHFHTPMTLPMPNGGQIFVTGSPETDSGYAQEFMAAQAIPTQRLHFINPRRGRVTSQHLIWLDDVDGNSQWQSA